MTTMMMKLFLQGILLFVSLLSFLTTTTVSADSAVVLLNSKNFDALTTGKVVFIKFFAPWCAHCKRMAKDWEKLAADWEGDKVGLIAEIDCTSRFGKGLCKYHNIESFPTIKYGGPYDLEEYNGGRLYEDLSKFAKENLIPICSPTNMELCDESTTKLMEKYLSMSKDELLDLVTKEEEKLKTVETKFQEQLQKLQEQYEQLEKEKKESIEEVRNGDLGIMKAVSKAMLQKESTTAKEKESTTTATTTEKKEQEL